MTGEDRLLATVWRVVESFAAALDRESGARTALEQRLVVLTARVEILEAATRAPAAGSQGVRGELRAVPTGKRCQQCDDLLPGDVARNRRYCYRCALARQRARQQACRPHEEGAA